MKFKVGDIVRTTKNEDNTGCEVFPIGTVGKIASCSEDSELPYRVETEDDYFFYSDDMLELYDKSYERGLNDAWELLSKLEYGEPFEVIERKELLGVHNLKELILKYTPQEALAKLKEYEEAKEIKVGNIVLWKDNWKGLVLEADEDTVHVLDENGNIVYWLRKDLKKSNGYIEVGNILAEIRGCE